jgi:dTDP-4-dehydrorhamnose 3,5-epimerase
MPLRRRGALPPGFAHGYRVLSEIVDLMYKMTAEFDPGLDRGIRWDDPDVGVECPDLEPVLSARDRALPPLSEAGNPFVA